jgi:hypothetical protein
MPVGILALQTAAERARTKISSFAMLDSKNEKNNNEKKVFGEKLKTIQFKSKNVEMLKTSLTLFQEFQNQNSLNITKAFNLEVIITTQKN